MNKPRFNSNDTLVIFGEQFPGGYINGLVQEAQKRSMTIIHSTTGRRAEDGSLRPLNLDELKAYNKKMLINVPLEAGFDMEKSAEGPRPIDLCQKAGRDDFKHFRLNQNTIKSARQNARLSFQNRAQKWVDKLSHLLPPKGNILIAHTMAGGVPRARIFMPILNRVLKGTNSRFFSSEVFWNSDLGKLCQKNFHDVTAETYRTLINITSPLAETLKKQGRQISFTAYSYHGTKILINSQYQWQSYAPYLQGFAKLELENISQQFFQQGINTCVFNVPEILTKSSAVFPGVELPLYCLLTALQKWSPEQGQSPQLKEQSPKHQGQSPKHKEGSSPQLTEGQKLLSSCLQKLKPGALESIQKTAHEYFMSPAVQKQTMFNQWPQHNTSEHIHLMLKTSAELAELHKDLTQTVTAELSQAVLKHCGQIIFNTFEEPPLRSAVQWIGHKDLALNLHKT